MGAPEVQTHDFLNRILEETVQYEPGSSRRPNAWSKPLGSLAGGRPELHLLRPSIAAASLLIGAKRSETNRRGCARIPVRLDSDLAVRHQGVTMGAPVSIPEEPLNGQV